MKGLLYTCDLDINLLMYILNRYRTHFEQVNFKQNNKNKFACTKNTECYFFQLHLEKIDLCMTEQLHESKRGINLNFPMYTTFDKANSTILLVDDLTLG